MGKMFEALQRSGQAAQDVIPALFDEEPSGPPPVGRLGASAEPEAEVALADAEPAYEAGQAEEAGAESAGQRAVDESPAAPYAAEPFAGVRVVPIRVEAGSPLLPFERAHPAAEQYRIIRTKLAHHPLQPRLIAVTSSGPGDGKSVSAVNLAAVMALKSDSPSLLIDADFRRSSVSKYLGIARTPGLAEVLEGRASLEDAVIRVEQLPTMYVLPAGEMTANPTELLDSGAWRALCEQAKKRFRFTLLDTPPVGAVADYDLLERTADAAVMIVRPNHTRRGACLKAIQSIPAEKLAGVIVNCAEDWILYRQGNTYDYYYGKED